MKHSDPDLLKQFRGPGKCECCGKPCQRREVAHIFARGRGDASRKDVVFNLIAVGRWPGCSCHTMHHAGDHPNRDDLLALVAVREGMSVDDIQERLWRIDRADKECQLCRRCGGSGRIVEIVGTHPTWANGVVFCFTCDGMGILNAFGEPWREDNASKDVRAREDNSQALDSRGGTAAVDQRPQVGGSGVRGKDSPPVDKTVQD